MRWMARGWSYRELYCFEPRTPNGWGPGSSLFQPGYSSFREFKGPRKVTHLPHSLHHKCHFSLVQYQSVVPSGNPLDLDTAISGEARGNAETLSRISFPVSSFLEPAVACLTKAATSPFPLPLNSPAYECGHGRRRPVIGIAVYI